MKQPSKEKVEQYRKEFSELLKDSDGSSHCKVLGVEWARGYSPS